MPPRSIRHTLPPLLATIPALAALTITLAALAPSGHGADKSPGASAAEPVYAVDRYDPRRDPAKDLAEAAKRAKADGRRILVQVGGDWCGWCRTLTKFLHENDAIAASLARNFLILKVNYSGANENEAFLDKYPEVHSFPHLFVFDEDGKLLHSQDMEEFEKGGGYSEQAVLGFLTRWAPAKKS